MPAQTVSRAPIGRAGSSTVLQPPYGTQQTKPTIVVRGLIAVRRILFTAKDVEKPERLHQVLYQMQQASVTALHALSTNPMSQGVLLASVTFTAAQTQQLNHGLGRAFTGFFVVDAQTNPWSGYRVALPAGVTSDRQIAILSNNAGTYSFWVY